MCRIAFVVAWSLGGAQPPVLDYTPDQVASLIAYARDEALARGEDPRYIACAEVWQRGGEVAWLECRAGENLWHLLRALRRQARLECGTTWRPGAGMAATMKPASWFAAVD